MILREKPLAQDGELSMHICVFPPQNILNDPKGII